MFFFSSRRRHTRSDRDWSSDVCSSDLNVELKAAGLTEVVTVTEEAPLLNTTSPEVGVRIDEKRISELPIAGQFGNGGGFRDGFSLALGAPRVSQTHSGDSPFTTGTHFSVHRM